MPEEHAAERHEKAGFGSGVFEDDCEQAGVLGLADEFERGLIAACLVEVLQRDRKRNAFDDHGNGYDDIAHERVAELRVGADLAYVVIALVNREASAQGEDHDGDDERPEIELVAVSVGVFQIGLPARPFHSEQQEQPVSAVDDRVDALGNHRGASGYGGGDELDDADGDVRQNGRDDGAEALAMLLGLVRAGRHSVRGVECDIGVDQLSVYFSLHSASF